MEHLAESPADDPMIILLTDGESSDIKPPLDVPIISDLQAMHIAVFAILTCPQVAQSQRSA